MRRAALRDQRTNRIIGVLVHLRMLRHFSQPRRCCAARCRLRNRGKTQALRRCARRYVRGSGGAKHEKNPSPRPSTTDSSRPSAPLTRGSYRGSIYEVKCEGMPSKLFKAKSASRGLCDRLVSLEPCLSPRAQAPRATKFPLSRAAAHHPAVARAQRGESTALKGLGAVDPNAFSSREALNFVPAATARQRRTEAVLTCEQRLAGYYFLGAAAAADFACCIAFSTASATQVRLSVSHRSSGYSVFSATALMRFSSAACPAGVERSRSL
jgi:hypothetical protein